MNRTPSATTPEGASTAAIVASVAAVLASVAFLVTGQGLQQTLLPVRGSLEGFSSVQLGLLGSCFSLGYVVGCLGTPRLIIRAGHARAFAALVAMASSASLCHALLVEPLAWMAFRLTTGACLAGLYLVIESWLNERADNRTRGTIMAVYLTINLAALALGQLLVPLMDPQSFAPLVVAAIALSLAAVPVALTTSVQPAPVTLVRFRPRALYATSPAGVVAIFFVGVSNGAFWTLGPVYGVRVGMSVAETASFMSLAVIGGALFQYPVGLLSDRIDRRLVMIGLALASIFLGLLLSELLPVRAGHELLLAPLFGAAILPAYTVAAAHVFDYAKSSGFVEVSAGLLFLFSIGSILGPVPAAALMELVRPGFLFLFMAAANACLALYVAFRMTRRRETGDKEDFRFTNVAPVVAVGAEAFGESPLVVTMDDPEPDEVLEPLAEGALADALPPER